MPFQLPRVYPITSVELSGLTHAEQVRELAAGGATFVQLREKHKSSAEFYAEAREAVNVARQLGVKLIINDRVDVALAVNADGVHLGQDDLPAEVARKLLGPTAIVGLSTHNVAQAAAARQLPIDYLAIGPIFPTQTKTDTEPVLGLDGVRAARRVIGDLPLVAIGGVTHENAAEVVTAGADCVALISGLVADQHNISRRTESLLKSITTPC